MSLVFNLLISSFLLVTVTSTTCPQICCINTTSIRYWVQQYDANATRAEALCGVIGDWITTQNSADVTNLDSTFANLPNFNADISGWQVTSVTSMYQTFMDAEAFNGDLSDWRDRITRVTSMESMFSGAFAFNGDISEWDMASVTNIIAMLNGAQSFDRDIRGWDLSNVVSGGFDSSISGLSSYDDCQKEDLFDDWNATYAYFRATYGSASSTDSSFYAAVCNATTEPGNPQSSDDSSGLIAIGSIIVVGLILISSCLGMLAVRRMYSPGNSAADKPVSSNSGAADYY